MGIVTELVLANLSDAEVVGFWMTDHQTADAGVRLHRTVLCQTDTDGRKINEPVEVEVEALVRQTGIAHSGANALKAFCVKVGDGELLIGRIAPVELTDGLVGALGGGFRQAVSKGLAQQMLVVVLAFIQMLYGLIRTGSEDADTIADALGIDRTEEIGKTKIRSFLLAQKGQ